MGKDVFLTAFLFPFLAFAFLGYLVYAYKQKSRPLFYILAIFIIINAIHFKYAKASAESAIIWLFAINLEAFAVFVFALLGYRKLRAASKE